MARYLLLAALLLAALCQAHAETQETEERELQSGSGGLPSLIRPGGNFPAGVSQVIMPPSGNQDGAPSSIVAGANPPPGFGASIAWTPTTTGTARVCVGSAGAAYNTANGLSYGAIYIYNSPNRIFSFQQVVRPPFTAGSPSLIPGFMFGSVIAASRNSNSAVLSGTNLFVGAPFSSALDRGDETVYFYSGTTVTTGLSAAQYTLVQQLRLTTSQTTNFGYSLALTPDDSMVVVGAPGYSGLSPSNTRYAGQGPLTGRAYVFNWVSSTSGSGAYTCLAILQAQSNPLSSSQEAGFGVAVAISGRILAVASMGSLDTTGQPNAGTGRLYIFSLGTSTGGTGQVSAASVPRFIQSIQNMPVSNPLALSMSGNYVILGSQRQATVYVMLNAASGTQQPDYSSTSPSFRNVISASGGASANTGMGQIVTSQMVNGRLYMYIGQPNANQGMVYISLNDNSVVFTPGMGVTSGLVSGFGASMVFNSDGNYLFGGNFLNQPHALVLSFFFESLGSRALSQRLISNDAQTAGAGVFSNYGNVVAAPIGGNGNLVGIGASLGPSNDGRAYLYTIPSGANSFSLQAVFAGTPASNFGAAMQVSSAGRAVGVAIGAPNPRGGYVNLYMASNPSNLQGTMTPFQQLADPTCVPLSNAFSCGANFGGSVDMNAQHVIVSAHNFGVQPGTGRVYVYYQRTGYGGSAGGRFSMQQVIVSPAQEFGFGVSVALTILSQNPHQRPLSPTMSGTFTTLIVASMGQPRDSNPSWPNMPNNVGGAYVYVRNGATFSVLQRLNNVPCPLIKDITGTGSTQAMGVSERNLYIGSVARNTVYVFQYDGIKQYSQMQILMAPNGGPTMGSNPAFPIRGGGFGSCIFANKANNGIAVGAPLNGSVYFYALQATQGFSLIRTISAQPNANMFGSAIDFSQGRFIVGAPGANIAGVYSEAGIMALPFSSPSPAPSGMARRQKRELKTTDKRATTPGGAKQQEITPDMINHEARTLGETFDVSKASKASKASKTSKTSKLSKGQSSKKASAGAA